MDNIDKLAQPHQLKEAGAITDQKFEAEKAKLLSRTRWPRERIIWTVATILLVAGLIYSLLLGQIPQTRQSNVQQVQPRPARTGETKLSRIFVPDILAANLEYLESIAGVAMSTNGETRHYTVDGCEVEALIQEGNVRAIAMEVNEKCSFDLNPFFNESRPLGQANRLTFADVIKRFGVGRFSSDCLRACGNTYDPSLRMTAGGAHVDNFNQITVETNSGPYSEISDAIVADRGEDWVISNAFGCEGAYDAMAAKLAAPAKVDKVTIWATGSAPACGSLWPI